MYTFSKNCNEMFEDKSHRDFENSETSPIFSKFYLNTTQDFSQMGTFLSNIFGIFRISQLCYPSEMVFWRL